MAYDYVITYTTNNTTYYLGMNGNSLQAKTTFDPTCIWTCYNGDTETTLSSDNSYSLRNKNNSTYYLTTSVSREQTGGSWYNPTYSYTWSALSVQNSASNMWRSSNASNGNVYAYYSSGGWNGWNRSASIYVNNLTMHDNNTSDSKNARVTITTGINDISNPTISGSDIITSTGNSNYTASGAKYKVGYTNYYFSNTDHYFDKDGNSFSGSPSNATIGTYTWSLTDNGYAALDANNPGRVVVSALPASDLTVTLTASATATGGNPAAPEGTVLSATKEITIQGSKPSAPIISINGTTVTLSTNASGSTTIRYTLDGSDPTTSSTAYSTPIDLSTSTTSPVTIKAITVRGGNASEVAEGSVTLTLPAPTISINGEAKTATITSSIQGATIRYTINGSDPTSTTGAVYDGQLTGLSYMANIKAIAVKEDWNDSPISSDIVTIPSGVNPSSGEVTLFDYEPHTWSYYSDTDLPDELHSLNPADIKITYNGNGDSNGKGNMTDATNAEAVDRPTSFSLFASGVQVGPNDAANKFIYYKTLERESPDGSGDLPYTTIPNPFQVRPYGESGTVTITPTSRSITITGYGSRSDASGSVSYTYYDENGTQRNGSVSISGTTEYSATILAKTGTQINFTLTRTSNNRTVYFTATYTNGSEIANGSRNSNGNANFGPYNITSSSSTISVSAYRGFYAWRVKSLSAGLTIKDAENTNTTYTANSIIPAERKILFVTSNEYNNEVVFEALWAQAYVQAGTDNLSTYVPADVPSAYERNFHIVNASTAASNFQKSYPCTVIGHEPNSTTLNNTRTITDGFSATADTKFEDITISGNNPTWNANGNDLIIGRGVTGTVNYLRGISSAVNPLNYKIRLESGTFTYISFLSGYEQTNGNASSTSITCTGTSNYVEGVLGCDYDRALNNNDNLVNTGTIIMGVAVTFSNQDVTKKTFDLTVKSGKFFTYLGNNMGAAGAEQSIYMGIANIQNSKAGARKITIQGGELASVAGGIDAGNQTSDKDVQGLTVRMTGGTVKGAIYGGAATSPASGNRTLIITGGTVKGWIGAGCNGVTGDNVTKGGQTYGKSHVYVGGNVSVGGSSDINGSAGGTVFAAGKGSGAADDTQSGMMAYGTSIAIADECDILNNVYGGGNYGFAETSTIMYILGGTIHGSVFGGSNQNKGPNTIITMKGGIVEGGLYGGSNSSGTVESVTMNINGGQVGTTSQTANIHGGGYGQSTIVSGDVDLTLGVVNQTSGVTVYGDVYGGSALGSVNGTSTSTSKHTNVTLNAGTINGSLYGGALGNAGTAANVYAPVAVTVNGGSVTGAVYGCNNVNGAPQSTVKVDINGTDQPESGYALAEVYGGGNKAAYGGTPIVAIHNCDNSIGYVYGGGNATDVAGTDITVWGGNTIGYVFGGGNGAGQGNPGANVGSGGTNVKIRGGSIDHVFGGGNMKGTISGDIIVNINKQAEEGHEDCTMNIGEVYGGGNQAPSSAGEITIVCTGDNGRIGKVFGGANAANISGNINLKINGGNIGDVFGGNNASGDITGTVSVTVGDNPENCGVFQIENVYGGGNLAPYGHSNNYPSVSIVSGTVTGGVYGGGYGQPAVITGNPQVTVTGGTIGAVYGGGNAAAVTGNTVVSVSNATVTGSVYGGGNAAGISGTTSVTVSSGTIGTGIYGGCNEQGTVGSTATVSVTGGIIGSQETPANIHGGGFGNATRVLGSVSVTLSGMTVNGDVYGGSAKGKTNGDAARTNGATTAVTMNSGTITGSIYGGGLGDATYAADVWGPVTLTINKGSTVGTNVYGGNNANGSPQVSIDVIVNGPTEAEKASTPLNLNNVYGGGNEANIAAGCTAPHVNIKGCGTVVNRAFGGGNAASVPATNIEIHGGTFQQVFGGGNGERGAQYGANVNGNVNLKIYAGTITSVFGGSNANGTISGDMNVSIDAENGNTCGTEIVEIYGGGNMAAGNAGAITINNCEAVIDTLYGGAKAADVSNNIVLNLVKGQIGSAFGGNNMSGTISGTITVNVNLDDCASLDYVYGAGNKAPYTGSPIVNVNNGTVNKSVYGGGKGATAVVTGNPVVTIGDATAAHYVIVTENVYGGGDAAAVTGNTSVTYNDNNANSTVANLFGGGNAAGVSGTATVTLTSGKVLTGVYGGCNASGKVGGAIALNINGGQVGTSANSKAYGIFGGGKGSETQTGDAVTVTIGTATNAQTYPTIYGDVYGGSAEGQVNDAIGEITKIWLKKGVINGDLYGGGFGDNGSNALVNGSVQVVVDGGTVTGKVFGCNNANGTPKGTVTVTINGTDTPQSGYALSEVYGGGNMANYVPTSVTPATVVVNGCNNSIGVVYGGGNAADVLGTDVTIWGGTIGQVFGGGHGNKDAQPATEANVVNREGQGGDVAVKIYGGTITEVFGGSNSKGTIQGESTVTIEDNGGSCTFSITDVYGGGNQAEGNAGTLAIGCGAVITGNVYGGAKAANVNNDIHLVITGGTLHNVFGGNNVSGTIAGTITVDIDQDDACTTWHVDNVYGGGNLAAYSKSGANYPEVNIKNGAVSGNVFGGGYGESARVTANPHVNLIGGTITGNVFGGGEAAPVTGSPVVTANYGQAANIYGGGLGSTAVVTGSPAVIISKTQNQTLTLTDVFGGGDAAAVTGSTAVTFTDGTVRNIYGGGNAAGVSQAVAVTINGGTVTTGVYGGCNASGTIGTDITLGLNGGTIGIANGTTNIVFGGGYGAGTSTDGNITVNVNGSTIHGHVYGGSALGSVNNAAADATTVNVLAGTVNGNIYGGGLGEAGAANVAKGQVNGTVTVNIGATDGAQTPTYSGTATINGSVYGCNNTNGSPKANVFVNVYKTAHNEAADGYAIDQVFGGGNQADYNPTSNESRTTVHVYTCDNTIRRVFAGGNAAAAIGVANIIDGGRFHYVYGGGNGEVSAADIGAEGTNLQVHGGNITYLFGGSNHSGTITGQMRVSVDGEGACAQDMYIAEFFCGNNEAPINTSIVAEIGCGTRFGDVYGGCNMANINGNVTLTIKGGEMNNVYGGSKGSNTTAANITGNVTLNIYGGNINNDAFGGSNINGNITGNIIVNMDWSQASESCNSESDLHVRNVFGASNLAAYTPTNASGNYPQVNIIHGTVSGSVFGAGNGDPNDPTKGIVTSNPVVTIGDANANHYVVVAENVYGGGNNASVTGSTTVTYNDNNASSTVAKLFGGGNAAGVTGAAAVTLTNGKVTGGVYGGCNSSGTIGGNALVTVTGGTVGANAAHANIHGGGYGQQTAVSGDVTVNIGSVTGTGNSAVYSGSATIYGDVYGGSALGTVNTDHSGGGTYNKTAVNLYGGTIDGNVYGGGLGDANTAALVYGDVDVFQYGAILIARYSQGLPSSGMIFGCNNVNGTPKGHVRVGVYKTTETTGQQRSSAEDRATHTESDHTYEMSAVFGGGNQAAYVPDDLTNGSTEVFINGCDDVSIHSVYGGGNAASTPATLVTIQGAYEIEYVFGGGNGAGTGNPGANVGYHAYNAADPAIGGPSDAAKTARQQFAYGSGAAKTQIYGGRLHKVFGGSNTLGNVRVATVAMLDETSSCPLELDGIYGGGKSAYMEGNAEIELGCIHGLDEIYGGAEQADVGSDIVLTLTSGHYNKVYGGNNLGGKIMGSITVNIEQTGCLPIEIGELYLGGNNAPYSVYGYNANGTIIESADHNIYDHPVMNLRSFKSIGTVFGGGEGSGATLAGNPIINVNVVTGWVDGQYKGTGDNDPNSQYHAAPQALTADGVIGTIFGGGNAAKVTGNTTINIGDQSTVEMQSLKSIKEKIEASQDHKYTTGGMVFELSDDQKSIKYTIQGNNSPDMTQPIIQTVNGANITGNVYGGGNQADVTGGTTINVGK